MISANGPTTSRKSAKNNLRYPLSGGQITVLLLAIFIAFLPLVVGLFVFVMQRDAVVEGVGLPPAAAGAPRRSEVTHLVSVVDSLRREIQGKDAELRSLQRGLDEKQRRLDEALASARGSTNAQSRLQSENDRLHRDVALLRSDKQSLDMQLRDATAYCSKLESKLTANGKDYLLEQNLKLRQGNKSLRDELDAACSASTAQRAELDRALREVETLAAALELRAEELGGGSGDLPSGLLYEVAVRREETRRLSARLAEAEAGLASAEFELRESRIAEERSAQEAEAAASGATALREQLNDVQGRLRECEKVRYSLFPSVSPSCVLYYSSAVIALIQRLEEVVSERDASLDFVSEQAARLEHAQMQTEAGERAAAALHQRIRDGDADVTVCS